MQKLVNGLHRFQSEVFHAHSDLFRTLCKGQHPEALFITCSDSRINPNLITQTEPGDLFIIRNAGNLVPPYGVSNGGESGTIEYAVAVLGIKHIIVCGHTLCGAMRALHDPASLEEVPAVKAWLANAEVTRRIIKENYAHLEGPARVTATVEENVLVQIENLRTHPAVRTRIGRGELFIYGWVYKIETGEIFQYEEEHGQFMPIGHGVNAAIPASGRLAITG